LTTIVQAPPEQKKKKVDGAKKSTKKKQEPVKQDAAPEKPKQADLTKRRDDPVPKLVRQGRKLIFDPKVWSKLVYMRDRGPTEISGFGVSDPNYPLHVIDFKLVPQKSISIFTEFEDRGLANYLEDMCAAGIEPARCMRIWIHTHPGMSPTPSSHDEETFERVNAESTWGVMCIVSDNSEYARGIVNSESGMSAKCELKTAILLDGVYAGVTEDDYRAWEDEYMQMVKFGISESPLACVGPDGRFYPGDDDECEFSLYYDISDQSVRAIEVDTGGGCYVYTEEYWLYYVDEQRVTCRTGDSPNTMNDISADEPFEFGLVVWNGDDPIRFSNDDEVEDYYDAQGNEGATIDDGTGAIRLPAGQAGD